MNLIYVFIFGIIIGVANIIPGVSGGTMAVILNIFDRLIEAISDLKKNFKKNILFLLCLGCGAVIGILAFTWFITWSLEHYPIATNFFFIGLILGSIPMILKRSIGDSFRPVYLIPPCLIAFGVMLVMVLFSPDDSAAAVITQLSVGSFIKLLLASILAAACMIIPGISGSFIMLLIGTYTSVTQAIRDINILVMIPVAIGYLIGFVGGAKGIKLLLKRYPQVTYSTILGLVIGSIPVLLKTVFWSESGLVFSFSPELLIALVTLALGTMLAYFLGSKIKEEKQDEPLSVEDTSKE